MGQIILLIESLTTPILGNAVLYHNLLPEAARYRMISWQGAVINHQS